MALWVVSLAGRYALFSALKDSLNSFALEKAASFQVFGMRY
jgi:hypothetical protein